MSTMPDVTIKATSNRNGQFDCSKFPAFIIFLACLNLVYARIIIKAPIATRKIPTKREYEGVLSAPSFRIITCISVTNKENLTTTNPRPIIAKLVRIQAKKVRSFARWSLAFSMERFFLSDSLRFIKQKI